MHSSCKPKGEQIGTDQESLSLPEGEMQAASEENINNLT